MSNLISKTEYRAITIALLLVAVLLSIVLKDVGTVSHLLALTFAIGVCILRICEHNGKYLATPSTVSSHLVQMLPKPERGSSRSTSGFTERHDNTSDLHHLSQSCDRSYQFWGFSISKCYPYSYGGRMIIIITEIRY